MNWIRRSLGSRPLWHSASKWKHQITLTGQCIFLKSASMHKLEKLNYKQQRRKTNICFSLPLARGKSLMIDEFAQRVEKSRTKQRFQISSILFPDNSGHASQLQSICRILSLTEEILSHNKNMLTSPKISLWASAFWEAVARRAGLELGPNSVCAPVQWQRQRSVTLLTRGCCKGPPPPPPHKHDTSKARQALCEISM